jgi:hypothetical protein
VPGSLGSRLEKLEPHEIMCIRYLLQRKNP